MEEFESRPQRPDTNLVWAILSTIFCCLPFGIASIVYAAQVDGLYSRGEYAAAQAASDKALKFAKISAIVAVACWLLYILIYVVFIGMILSAGSF